MSKNALYGIIVVLVLVIVGGGAYLLGRNTASTPEQVPATVPGAPTSSVPVPLSEQSNQALFEQYFTNITMEKLPAGVTFSPATVIPATHFDFAAGDQFCLSFDVIKDVSPRDLTDAVYNRQTKVYPIPKQSAGGPGLKIGNNLGCEDLRVGPNTKLPAGQY